jgi:hypothetical protein
VSQTDEANLHCVLQTRAFTQVISPQCAAGAL